MIEQPVRKEANRFANFWNELFIDYPKLKLDFTWPSVGIIDKILFPLRNKKLFNSVDYDFIKGAAAYIGIITYKNWSNYPDVKCELKLEGDQVKDFILYAEDGDKKINIKLGKSVEDIINSSNKEVNFFAQDKKHFTFSENLLSPSVAGIVSGLSPYVNGEWNKKTIKEFEKNLVLTAKNLSKTCVEFYQNRYAGESYGANQKVYLPNLVIPPIASNEPYPAARASVALANHIALNKYTKAETKALCKNLCFSPDQTISIPAILISCCLYENNSPNWLLAITNSLGFNLTLLKPTLNIIRDSFNQKDSLENTEHALKDEYNLGFLPLYFLPSFSFDYELPENLLYFLSWSSLEKAHDSISNFLILEKLHPALALQLAFLKINFGKAEQANEIIKSNFQTIPEDEELKYKYLELQYYLTGESSQLEQALGTKDKQRLSTITTLLTRDYLAKQEFDKVIKISDEILSKIPWSINLQINKLMALLAKKEDQKIDHTLEELSDYFTVNNQLFSFLKARKMSVLK